LLSSTTTHHPRTAPRGAASNCCSEIACATVAEIYNIFAMQFQATSLHANNFRSMLQSQGHIQVSSADGLFTSHRTRVTHLAAPNLAATKSSGSDTALPYNTRRHVRVAALLMTRHAEAYACARCSLQCQLHAGMLLIHPSSSSNAASLVTASLVTSLIQSPRYSSSKVPSH